MDFNKPPTPPTPGTPPAAEKNILDCRPGYWETLTEPVSLTGEYHGAESFRELEVKDKTRSVTVPAGTQINVMDPHHSHDGKVHIKFNFGESAKNFWLWIPQQELQGKKIKVQSKG